MSMKHTKIKIEFEIRILKLTVNSYKNIRLYHPLYLVLMKMVDY